MVYEVIQSDREAASALLMKIRGYDVGRAIREGRNDNGFTVQAFAQHRVEHGPE